MTSLFLVLRYLIFVLSFVIIDFFGVFKHLFELDYATFNYPMHGNVSEYAYNLRFNRRTDVRPINIYNYTFIYNSQICLYRSTTVPRLTYLIKSAVPNFERRLAIRKTWGRNISYPNSVHMVFLLGSNEETDTKQLIRKESEQFKDIVCADFVDSYYNNSIKTLMGFRWAVEYCAQSTYFMFVDDDYYVSTKNVLQYIENQWKNIQIFTGRNTEEKQNSHISQKDEVKLTNYIRLRENLEIRFNRLLGGDSKLFAGYRFISSPHRHKSSKWYIELSEYPFHMWPPYITAGAYILSREALMEMYYVSMFTKHFKFDDVYLGILALKAKINITHSADFYFRKAMYSRPVDYKHVIASHGYGDHRELMRTWSECYLAGFA